VPHVIVSNMPYVGILQYWDIKKMMKILCEHLNDMQFFKDILLHFMDVTDFLKYFKLYS
jgi:hypothetical protein